MALQMSVAKAPRLLVPLLLIAALLLVGCPSKGGSSDTITGLIEVEMDQRVVPLAQAFVTLVPFEPDATYKKQDEAPELTTSLKGVSTTNASGSFVVANLASSETFMEYPLLRGWTYQIRIEAPGYYIHEGTFTYEKGAQTLKIKLETKDTDVVDDSGVIKMREDAIQMGASPKRGV
jgi:hypothetical protein